MQITEPRPTTVWYLRLDQLKPSSRSADVRQAEVPFGPLNRFFYEQIGQDFHWTHMRDRTETEWQTWAESIETWIAYDRGTPAGYAEVAPFDGAIDLRTFGLLEPFRGRGIGGAFLTRVIERQLELAAPEGLPVTVNTCELDGPHARANYEARGFVLDRETVEHRPRFEP